MYVNQDLLNVHNFIAECCFDLGSCMYGDEHNRIRMANDFINCDRFKRDCIYQYVLSLEDEDLIIGILEHFIFIDGIRDHLEGKENLSDE